MSVYIINFSKSSLAEDYELDQKMRVINGRDRNSLASFREKRELVGSLAVSPSPTDRKEGIERAKQFLNTFLQTDLGFYALVHVSNCALFFETVCF